MSKIKIAVQKAGRLNEDSLQLLKECGISIDNGKDQLKASASNFPLEVLYLRNGDIPQYLRDGVVDIAIIGENVLIEKGTDIGKGFEKLMDSILAWFKPKTKLKTVHRSKKKTFAGHTKNEFDEFNNQKQIDIILDKISKSGYETLTPEEKEFLFRAGKK